MEDNKIDVLDRGYIRLVDSMGSDLSIARAARVSYDAHWRAGMDSGSDARLIRYLWSHQHTSPFEAVTLTFEVKAPIFVIRQWHRHRTWSYNEVSGRYKELPEEYYVPRPEHVGRQSTSNRQCRVISGYDWTPRMTEVAQYDKFLEESFEFYRNLLSLGWPRELARNVLPLATYTHMFATVNLLNLFRFLTLRCAENAQFEIRQYAQAAKELARSVAPVSVEAWESREVRAAAS